MADGGDSLDLLAEFPPVDRAEWDAAIRFDLKGADYDNKLVWRTEEGIPMRPYYCREDLEELGELADLAPGQFPFTRGTGHSWQEAQEWTDASETSTVVTVRADHVHESGGTATQELAFSIAEAVEKLRNVIDQWASFDATASSTLFVFAVGSNYFVEIAKLRAIRLLWAAVVAAYEGNAQSAANMRVHVLTARDNKSFLDNYTNLLRATTEAMSAVIGGCDSLTVQPIGFEEHLATGVQRILREEAHLARAADPAGGSYFLETLTHTLAHEAWKLFQQIEHLGGWNAAVRSGFVEQEVTHARSEKINALALRTKTMVGVNNYPNLTERLDTLPVSRGAEPRFAEPFEQIRVRTERHVKKTGRRPKVMLLKRGDVRTTMARANFCLNFFGCAGFEIAETDDYAGSDVDLIVLCSSDPEYVSFAREICAVAHVPVLVAGNPREHVAELELLGVEGFIQVDTHLIETLTYWQSRLGIQQ